FTPFEPAAIAQLRFSMRRRDRGFAQAQLFWTHDAGAGFSEALSATVELDGTPGEWREYRILLDAGDVRAAWWAGARIERLRFDPMSVPGVFDLGSIELVPGRPETPWYEHRRRATQARGAPGA